MVSDRDSIFIGSEHSVNVLGLKDTDTNLFVNDASCTAQVLEADRTTTVGGSISLPYRPQSRGDYRGSLTTAITNLLTEGDRYFVQILITGTVTDTRYLSVVARYRGEV